MKPGRAPTWAEARTLAEQLALLFGATIVNKRGHWLFEGIAKALDAVHALYARLGATPPKGLMTGAEFLDQWCTTLGTLIGMCAIEDPGAWLDAVLHELEHVVQVTGAHGDDAARARDPYAMPGGVGFVLMYLLGQAGDLESWDEGRAKAEGQAEAVRAEGHHARTGELPSADDAAAPFCTGAYALQANGKGVIRGVLAARLTSAAHGGRNSRVSQAFVSLCQKRYPELLAQAA